MADKNGETPNGTDNVLRCSLCEQSIQHGILIRGRAGCICQNCVRRAASMLIQRGEEMDAVLAQSRGGALLPRRPTPASLKAFLDTHVIGQDLAKRALCVAVYNHYKRLEYLDGGEIGKSNILLIGPTGSGKTLLAQTLAKALDVPFAIADATSLTEAGYVGDDVENILLRLIQAANGDIGKAQHGIIYVDEIDKIARLQEGRSVTRDVSGEGVQQALLKIVEGTVASVPANGGRKHPNGSNIQINTKDILFIFGGAFEGIRKIMERRARPKTIGFAAVQSETVTADMPTTDDLVKFGLIPEFVGRLPVITVLDQLDEAALLRVLTEPKGSLVWQYEQLLGMDGVQLVLEEDALRAMAQEAVANGTGARGLRSIMERVLQNTMFDAPTYETPMICTVTEACVTDNQAPVLMPASQKTCQEAAGVVSMQA